MYISPINYQQNYIKLKSPNFRSQYSPETLAKMVFSNPEAEQVIKDAMSNLRFNESTAEGAMQKLKEILGIDINEKELVELFLAGLTKF